MRPLHAAILSIGDELTLGQRLNTNSAWLAQRLAEQSIMTLEHRTIADDRVAIAAAILELAGICEVLLITGGLGPTEDDLTREALNDAIAPGEALVVDSEARLQIEQMFARRGRPMPRQNLRQALRPAVARCLPNPFGTAPGLGAKLRSCQIFCLPGPPREMQPMFLAHVAPALPKPSDDQVVLTGSVQEFGLGESDAAERLGDLMQRDRNPLVGTTASDAIVSARVRVTGAKSWAADQLEQTLAAVERAWEPYAFGRDEISLAHVVGDLLLRAGRTLAVAESCTGGWLAQSIVDRAGSSGYFLGGWVTYSNQMKVDCLGVPASLIEKYGAVSAQVAQAMASGALRAAGADYGLAITGIAGPDGGSAAKPVGTVFIALASKLDDPKIRVRHFHFPAERMVVRDRSVKAALQMLRFALLGVDKDCQMLWEVRRPEPAATSS